jgi:hypothetical protein
MRARKPAIDGPTRKRVIKIGNASIPASGPWEMERVVRRIVAKLITTPTSTPSAKRPI